MHSSSSRLARTEGRKDALLLLRSKVSFSAPPVVTPRGGVRLAAGLLRGTLCVIQVVVGAAARLGSLVHSSLCLRAGGGEAFRGRPVEKLLLSKPGSLR